MSQKSIISFKSFCEQQEYFLLVALLALGLIVRLVLIFSVTEPIDRDAKEYYDIAQNMVAGKGFSIDGIQPTAHRSPGYPLFLAGLMAVFGSAPRLLYISQALVNLLTIFLVYLSLKYLKVKNSVRLFVVLLFSLSTSFIYVNVLYGEIVTMFFVALILYIAVHPSWRGRWVVQSIMTGLSIGCLIYLRPTFLYLPLFILILAVVLKILHRISDLRQSLVIAGIALLSVVPWTVRNYLAFQRFIPLVSAGGGELWGANLEITQRPVWYSVTDIARYEAQRTDNFKLQRQLIAQYRHEYNLSDQESLNRFLSRQAKINILHHPFRYALLCLNRLLIFWFSPPIGSTVLKSASPILFISILLLKYTVTILAIYGIGELARHHFADFFIILMMIIYFTLLHAATHAIQRYFLPLIPVVYFTLGYTFEILSDKSKIVSNG